MKQLRILALAATAVLATSTWASAQEAFTTGDVNMRAGPGSRYPVVTTIPENREVFIHGCLANWDWCDVSWRRNRGWVFSDYLEALYRSRRIGFDEYRSYVDIPFVSFGFGYWDRYYRDRPWFDDWDHWDRRRDRREWRRNRDDDRVMNRGDMNDDRDDGDTVIRRDRRNRDVDVDRNRDCDGPNPPAECLEGDGGDQGANNRGNRSDRGDRRNRGGDQMEQANP